jgi:CRP/FNR family transcriptional regulator, cyclic AMP receptor protein
MSTSGTQLAGPGRVSRTAVVAAFPVLDAVDAQIRARLLGAARRRRFARNEVVFHEGDPADAFHLLASGHVCVRVVTPMGDTAILTILGPGATFGELALLSGDQPRAATVAALDRVETLVLSRADFDGLRREYPGVDRFLVGLLAGYLRELDERLVEALYVPVRKRVMRRLIALSQLYGDGSAGTVIPLTQETLASLAGSTRSTTNQTLRGAADSGLISLDRGQVRIEDPAGLARRAR